MARPGRRFPFFYGSGALPALLVAIAGAAIFYPGTIMADKKKDIVYIEASTVNRWKLKEFGKRVNDDRYSIETMTLYEFDKTPRVDKALNERDRKPEVMVVQECSVYFPGDLQDYQGKYRAWIRQIKQAGVTPVIATTVPPAASQGFVEDAKAWIKVKILGRDSQHEQVAQFNDWLRSLAREEGVALFDLEALTRKSDSERVMREEYSAGDGIHLNAAGYSMLDQELHKFLKTLK
jgi:hypothetical protein